jgi:hypothetical protein
MKLWLAISVLIEALGLAHVPHLLFSGFVMVFGLLPNIGDDRHEKLR